MRPDVGKVDRVAEGSSEGPPHSLRENKDRAEREKDHSCIAGL